MKIAVTALDGELDSKIDPRFGRAAYIIIVDSETLEFKALDNNKNKNSFKGAGSKAVAMVSDNEAEVILTGCCGPNAFKALESAGIKVVDDQSGRVIEVVQKFKQGNVVYAEKANQNGYW